MVYEQMKGSRESEKLKLLRDGAWLVLLST